MRKIIAGLLALAVWTLPAFPQYVPYEVDFADGSLSAPLNTSVGNTPTIRVYYKQNGTNFNPSSYESYLKWGKDDSSIDGMVTVPGVENTNGYSDFFCASNTFGKVVKDGYWSVYLTRSNGTQNITAIRAAGGLQVERSPEISNVLALQRTTAINWDLLVNTGTLPWVSFAVGANTDILARINIGVLSNWVVGVSNALSDRIDSKGTGSVASLAGVTMQGGVHTGGVQATSSAGLALSNVSGSNVLVLGIGGGTPSAFAGALTVNGGSEVATGTPLYVESDPLAITNLQESGSGNAITGSSVVGRSGVLYRGTVAGGSGSETQGFASVQSLGNSAPTVNLQSAYVVIGGSAEFYPHPLYDNDDLSAVIIGGGGADSEGSGRTNNVISNAFDSVIIGGNGNRISGMPPGGVSGLSTYQQILGSHASDIGWSDTNLTTKYNTIVGGNNHHVWDSSFSTVLGGGGTFIYNSDSVGSLSASHHLYTNCEQVLGLGGVISMSNRAGVIAFADDWHNDTNALVPNRDSAAMLGVTWIQQTGVGGTYDLFTNGWLIASILSPDNQYNNTNDIPRQFGWVGGQRNRFHAPLFQPGGTNIFGLVGGGGYSNAWLMTTARGSVLIGGVSNIAQQDISGSISIGGIGNSMNNARNAAMLGGRANIVLGEASAVVGGQGNNITGGWSLWGGRENTGAANYQFGAGFQNQIQASAQFSSICGGRTNVIAGPLYAVIGGGGWNTIGSGGVGATIPGGLSNTVLSAGGFAAGNAAIVSATGTNAFIWNGAQLAYTNSTARSAVFNVPGGFIVVVGGNVFQVLSNGTFGAVGTGSWSFTESGLIVNGVVK